jgi:hypothetical protein
VKRRIPGIVVAGLRKRTLTETASLIVEIYAQGVSSQEGVCSVNAGNKLKARVHEGYHCKL